MWRMHAAAVTLAIVVLAAMDVRGQAVRVEVPDVTCPAELGLGAATKRTFCDVITGLEPEDGIVIKLPPRRGEAILTFDLHNRHTYSEEQTLAGEAYRRYTATIGVLTMNNDLLTRAVVQSEFRTAGDLVDRVSGGAGPTGLKAIAPTGTEPIVVRLPQNLDAVSILGERLELRRLDGREVLSAPGRPVAVISNVQIEYRPAPAAGRR